MYVHLLPGPRRGFAFHTVSPPFSVVSFPAGTRARCLEILLLQLIRVSPLIRHPHRISSLPRFFPPAPLRNSSIGVVCLPIWRGFMSSPAGFCQKVNGEFLSGAAVFQPIFHLNVLHQACVISYFLRFVICIVFLSGFARVSPLLDRVAVFTANNRSSY